MNKEEMKEKAELASKTIKDFLSIQKTFFGDALKMYFSPLVVVYTFFMIFVDMFRQMFISLVMSAEDYEKYQQVKVGEEIVEMLAAEEAEKEEG